MRVHWLAWRMSLASAVTARGRSAPIDLQPAPSQFDWSCHDRGPVLRVERTDSACACGTETVDVYQCRRFGECTLRKVRSRRGHTWQSCVSCLGESL